MIRILAHGTKDSDLVIVIVDGITILYMNPVVVFDVDMLSHARFVHVDGQLILFRGRH